MRPSFVLIAGLAALPLLAIPQSAAAQSGFHPRWEIPGFDFRKNGGWRVRAQRVADMRRQLIAQRSVSALQGPSGPALSQASVTGTMLVPALLFSYQGIDSVLFMKDTAQYTSVLFGAAPPGGNPYTLRTFYEQMSRDSFSLRGKMIGWVRLDSAEVAYTGTPGSGCSGNPFGTNNCNGLFSSNATNRMQNGFRQALARVDGTINFAQFDNDGPDLIPNSADDDGYVDMIMFAHPTKDGACGGNSSPNPPGSAASNNHIWSHRFVLANATQTDYNDYITNDVRFGGGSIHISDYFATTALGGASACDTTQIMPIGTAAHEFGHALGLPDLYDTQGVTEGSGQWALMGSGNFASSRSPSRMEAWSLNELGWVTLRILTTTGTYNFGAAPVSDTAFYVSVQGTNPRSEYFLLENRQASQADTAVIRRHCLRSYSPNPPPPSCGGGLLIWHADSTQIAASGFRSTNRVNAGAIHGLAVQEADGLRQLWCGGSGCNRGDAGDVYPGTSNNTAFSFNTTPAATKNLDGSFVGFAIDSIRQVVPGGEMAFRLRFGGLTVVRASDTNAVISVDATNYNVFRNLFDDGSIHSVSVADTQFSINNRTRWRFASWSDGGLRTHDITASLAGSTVTANLNRDFKLIATASAGGTIASNPVVNLAGEFRAEGSGVQLTATPTAGATFAGWSGDTVTPNPIITLPMGRPYTVTAVFVTTADVVAHLLGPTAPLTLSQQQTLDANGNNNGSFDVGDFLAWVKTTGAPLSVEALARLARTKGGRP